MIGNAIMKPNVALFTALSSFLLLNISKTYCYDTRDLLPDKGYWNLLPQYGLGGRLIHYLMADSDAFGNEVTNLDIYFNERYTPEKYQALERQIVFSLPLDDIKYRLGKLLPRLMSVRDPKTGKTLGSALFFMFKLQNDPEAVKEIADRLNLKDPRIIALEAPNGGNFDLESTLKNTILYNPTVVIKVLQDPQVVHFLTSSVLQYLSSNEVNDGIHKLQGMIGMLEIAYSDVLRNSDIPIFAMKDKRSGLSLAQTLKALANIIESSEFAQALVKLLNENTVDDFHKKTQEMFSKAGEEKQKPKMSAEKLNNMLSLFGVKLGLDEVNDIIALSNSGQLAKKVITFLDELDDIEDLDSDKLTQFLRSKGADLGAESVEQVLDMATETSPADASIILGEFGLNISQRQAEIIINLIKKIKSKYDVNRPNPMDSASESSQVEVIQTGDTTQQEEAYDKDVSISKGEAQPINEIPLADEGRPGYEAASSGEAQQEHGATSADEGRPEYETTLTQEDRSEYGAISSGETRPDSGATSAEEGQLEDEAISIGEATQNDEAIQLDSMQI